MFAVQLGEQTDKTDLFVGYKDNKEKKLFLMESLANEFWASVLCTNHSSAPLCCYTVAFQELSLRNHLDLCERVELLQEIGQ